MKLLRLETVQHFEINGSIFYEPAESVYTYLENIDAFYPYDKGGIWVLRMKSGAHYAVNTSYFLSSLKPTLMDAQD
jgi:hypothetical protein